MKPSSHKPNRWLLILSWTAVLLWMAVILSFSSEPAEVSKLKSQRIVQKVEPSIEKVEVQFQAEWLNKVNLHAFVRKTAHVFNYFVLTILLIVAWKISDVNKPYLLTWLTAVPFSILDEYFQTFILGRGGQVKDVFIDQIGVMLGMMLVYMMIWALQRKHP